MATSFSYDSSSLRKDFFKLSMDPRSPPPAFRANFNVCIVCHGNAPEEKLFSCMHMICRNCWSFFPSTVCPLCRVDPHRPESLIHNYSFRDLSSEGVNINTNDKVSELEARNFSSPTSISASFSVAPSSVGIDTRSAVRNFLSSSAGSSRSSTGAIPKVKRDHQRFPAPNNWTLIANSQREVRFSSNVMSNNGISVRDDVHVSVKNPPLSPVVGGETRNPRLPIRNPLSSPLQNNYLCDELDINYKIPTCSHELLNWYCLECLQIFCPTCSHIHRKHDVVQLTQADSTLRPVLQDVLTYTWQNQKVLVEGIAQINSIFDVLNKKKMIVEHEINQAAKILSELIENRKILLLEKLYQSHASKAEILLKQLTDLKNRKYNISKIREKIQSHVVSKDVKELIKAHISCENLKRNSMASLDLIPHEDAVLQFRENLKEIAPLINKFGCVYSTAKASNTKILGIGSEKALLDTETHFTLQCYDHVAQKVRTGGESIKAILTLPSGKRVNIAIKDHSNGDYTGMFISNELGEHLLRITLRNFRISSSDLRLVTGYTRSVRCICFPPIDSFGKGPDKETSFSRGWGIYCDKDGMVYVTDRNLHCVLVFRHDLEFHHKFGKYGEEVGELNRPTGITLDIFRRLIVVDKDNHRIQIFTTDGEYIMKFGKRGSGNGEFHYPWDVDANSFGQIVVSDSRNHRIQLFDKNGICLKISESKYSHIPNVKKLEIPRGVCFDLDGNIVVSDFNNHYLLIFNIDSSPMEIMREIGPLGLNEKERWFHRPQGLFVTNEGVIFVAESKERRIQMYAKDGTFLKKLGETEKQREDQNEKRKYEESEESNVYFAPCDVTMSPEGFLYAVDIERACVYRL